MAKYPFTVYRIRTATFNEKVPLPMDQFRCAACNELCGHTSWVQRYETKEVTSHTLQKYDVIGASDTEYFVNLSAAGIGEFVDTIPIDQSYKDRAKAMAELQRLESTEVTQ